MHVVLFQMKRAYHATLALGRRILNEFELTPARFDLLYVVMRRWWRWGSRRRDSHYRAIVQEEIRRELGVSAPTVSRMLQSLEDLGLIRRETTDYDRRRKYVFPTVKCRRLMRLVVDLTLGNGFSELAVRSIFVPERWCCNDVASAALERLVQRFRSLRQVLRDRTSLWDGKELYSDRSYGEWCDTRDLQPLPGLPFAYYSRWFYP
jgi:DNA-binding MarR family transcriptional regulator